jgi:hypothetical protein
MKTRLGVFCGTLLWCTLAGAAPLKIAVVTLTTGEGVVPGVGTPLTEAVVAELRKQPGASVLAPSEMTAMLSHEQQKQLLGCESEKCRVDLGTAAGADRLVLGDVARLGESWLLHLKLLDVQKAAVVSQVDRRQKGGTVDDLLDALPSMVKQLMAGEQKDQGAPVAVAAAAPVVKKGMPAHGADVPMAAADAPKGLRVVSDGKGAYLAYVPGEIRTLFKGDGKTWMEVRTTGGGRNGDNQDVVFWEPRVKDRWMGSFAVQDKVHKLFCGDKTFTFTPVPDGEAGKMLAGKFFKVRWQRMLYALGRDDLGTYYLVDQPREAPGTDLRLYVGRKGDMKPAELTDALVEHGSAILITPTGRLKLQWPESPSEKATISWLEGQATTQLKWLPVEDNAALVYGEMSVYKTEPLGTPCDGRL